MFDLPESSIKPLITVCLGFKRNEKWVLGWIKFGAFQPDPSLFYNGVLFVRIMAPFFIGLGIRWSGSSVKRSFLQTYLGWKGNGQLSAAFRIQSDESAASGYTGPNYGQAQGWNEGTK